MRKIGKGRREEVWRGVVTGEWGNAGDWTYN
jgi:hypothetical protein